MGQGRAKTDPMRQKRRPCALGGRPYATPGGKEGAPGESCPTLGGPVGAALEETVTPSQSLEVNRYRVGMELWTAAVVGALAGIVGTILTYLASSRELRLRRRTETIGLFLRVAGTAHGRRDGADGDVGTGEQMAAMFLLADLASRDDWLRAAGSNFLDEQMVWLTENEHPVAQRLLDSARVARAMIREK